VYIDKNFDIVEQQYIIEAAQEWRQATNYLVDFNLVFNFSMDDIELVNSRYALVIKKVDENDPSIVKIDKDLKDALGLYDPRPNTPMILLVVTRLDFANYRATALHEFGHSLFLRHLDSKKAIMYPYISKEDIHKNITADDLEQFCELYECFNGDSK
jgi:predicted Zn-dependent protease